MARALATRLLLAAGVGWAAATAGLAQEQTAPPTYPVEVERQARELASKLRCPVCLNLSIEDSPSPLAREMKDLIRERIARGETPEQVRQYFLEKYGEWILLTPEPQGANLALWVVPAFVGLAGLAVVFRILRGWVRRGGELASAEVDK